jgi:hypothetical protein
VLVFTVTDSVLRIIGQTLILDHAGDLNYQDKKKLQNIGASFKLRVPSLRDARGWQGGRQFIWFKSSMVNNTMCLDLVYSRGDATFIF